MLYDAKTHQPVFVNPKKEMSDHMKRSVIEKLNTLPHKGHPFFRLEERATIKCNT